MKTTPSGSDASRELGVDRRDVSSEVKSGLAAPQKRLPSKLFYDQEGSRLFDEICELPEYYLTGTETSILENVAPEIAKRIGPGAALIELGAGSCVKVRILLDALESPAAFVPIDVSRPHLEAAACEIDASYPDVEIIPVAADFTRPLELPDLPPDVRCRVVFFPGSTIGNFEEDEATTLLELMAHLAGPRGSVLIGVDLVKDPEIIRAAYNDSNGVTARFNRNILRVVNREFGGDFHPERFEHEAVYDATEKRIEMRLISRAEQRIRVGDEEFHFQRGEHVITEYSHKYSLDDFASLARRAGLRVRQVWCDPDDLFSVQYLEVVDDGDRHVAELRSTQEIR